jgi:hypothetical protein
MEYRECSRCGDDVLILNSQDECMGCEEERAHKVQLDPSPYLWRSGGRTTHGSRWGSRPACRFAPRPEYSQNPEDYS